MKARMRYIQRPFVAVAAVAALALGTGLSSCGSPNEVPAILRAERTTLAQRSGIEYFFVQLHHVSLHGPPLLSGLKLPSGNQRYGGIGYFDLTNDKGQLTIDTPTLGSIEVALYARRLIVEFPPEVLGLPPGVSLKPFLSIDLDTLNSASSVPIQAVAQVLEVANPVQSLAYLNGATESSTLVGSETLTGPEYGTGSAAKVSTTHYTVDVDMAHAAQKASGPTRTGIQQVMRLLHTSHSVIDVWVDRSGRIRRATDTIDLSHLAIPVPGNILASESLSGSATIITTFGSFGTATSIGEPAPSQVADATALLKAFDFLTAKPPG